MHIPTHVFSGWCVANTLPLDRRERLLAMLAATLADLDGIPTIHSADAYFTYHHLLCHNLAFGLLLAAALTALSRPARGWKYLVYLGLFHLHLFMDYLGSGKDWEIFYFWPFDAAGYAASWVWEYDSWQNYLAFGLLLAWVVWIYRHKRRGPLETLWPYADNLFVRLRAPRAADPAPAPAGETPPPADGD